MMMDSIPPFTDGSSSSSSSSSSSVMVSPLVRTSSSTILSARRCWNKIDAASSGYVSSNDMYQYLQRFIAQHQPTPSQTQSRVNNSSRNGEEKEESPQSLHTSGLSSTAFASSSSSSSSAPPHSSSSSSPSSLSAAAASLCQRARAISQKDLDELIAFADCNGDNKLDLDEMLQAYQSFTSPSVSLMARFESQILEKGLSGALPPPASRHALNGNSTVAHRSMSNNSTISSTPILPISSESNGPIGLAPPADSTNTGPVPKLADIFLASSIKLPSVSPASSSSSSSHPTHPASSTNLPSTSIASASLSSIPSSSSSSSSSSAAAAAAAAALSPSASASGNAASMIDVDGQSFGQDYDPIEMIEISDSEPFE